jgi:transcriptional regulator with XRE-family HTH domain
VKDAIGGIGPAVRRIRRQKRILLKDLCKAIGMTPNGWRAVEQGRNGIQKARILKVAQALDVPVATLLSAATCHCCGQPIQVNIGDPRDLTTERNDRRRARIEAGKLQRAARGRGAA